MRLFSAMNLMPANPFHWIAQSSPMMREAERLLSVYFLHTMHNFANFYHVPT